MAFDPTLGNPFATLGIDFYGFFLPWIFTFAIVYGLLAKLNLFGGKNDKISMALAFVIAFFVSAVGGPQLATFFTSIFGGAAMFLAGILVIILFAALLGHTDFKHMGALVIVVIIGIFLFLSSSNQFISVSVIGPDVASLIFWIVIIIVAIYFVTHEKKDEQHH
ncbi:hypothetical protein HYZ41_01100 [archaeon]|nr:hypothetical protein [archaeon]